MSDQKLSTPVNERRLRNRGGNGVVNSVYHDVTESCRAGLSRKIPEEPDRATRRAVSAGFGAVRSVVGLLLWSRFRFVGLRRVRRRAGFAGRRVPVRVLGPPALGRLAARRFWRVGARVGVGLAVLILAGHQ